MFDVLWVAIVFGWFARSLAFYRPWIVVVASCFCGLQQWRTSSDLCCYVYPCCAVSECGTMCRL